jgi:hypothetical protein
LVRCSRIRVSSSLGTGGSAALLIPAPIILPFRLSRVYQQLINGVKPLAKFCEFFAVLLPFRHKISFPFPAPIPSRVWFVPQAGWHAQRFRKLPMGDIE